MAAANGEELQLITVKKTWLNPELILIARNEVEVKSSHNIHEATGHAVGYPASDHAFHAGHHFINAAGTSSTFTFNAAS